MATEKEIVITKEMEDELSTMGKGEEPKGDEK